MSRENPAVPTHTPWVRNLRIACPLIGVLIYAAIPFLTDAPSAGGLYITASGSGALAYSGADTYTAAGFIVAFCLGLVGTFGIGAWLSYRLGEQTYFEDDEVLTSPAGPSAAQRASAEHAANMEEIAAEEKVGEGYMPPPP